MIGSILFTWLHRSDFYSDFHKEACAFIPDAESPDKIWMDIGCGPGVLSREAQTKSYKVIGLDYDQRMIDAAKKFSLDKKNEHIEYKQFDLFNPNFKISTASVVSASSLLPVLQDKKKSLRLLFEHVAEGGKLIIIETNYHCSFKNVFKLFMKNPKISELGLILLGLVRRGRSPSIHVVKEYFKNNDLQQFTLSNGIVDVFIVTKVKTEKEN